MTIVRRKRPSAIYPDGLEGAKARKQDAVRTLRWRKETGGVDFGGTRVRSDETSQSKINGLVSLFDKDPSLSASDWEATPGQWVEIDRDTAVAMGIAVGRHVQACFSRARILSEAITAAESEAELAAIDIETGWPE